MFRIRRRRAALAALTLYAFWTLPASAASEQRGGRFEGRSRHTAEGGVTLLSTESGYLVVLEADFAFDGAPDPKLGFGKGGFVQGTLFSKLRANRGAQVYEVPRSVDPAAYDEIWIWCEKFGVPLGVASLR